MCTNKLSLRIEGQGCVVMLLRLFAILGYASTNDVGSGFFGKLGQRVERRRLLLRRWGGEERLGVFGEVFRTVRTVEAFGQDFILSVT